MSGGMSARTALILGEEGVRRLERASVVLAGAGAVGGYALEGLVRAGVGRIRVIDGDVFEESNLNRQILAVTDTLGRPKAEVAAERARSINPGIITEPVTGMIDGDSDLEAMIGRPDIIVDAVDGAAGKTALLSYAVSHGIPAFSSMGAALRTDPSKVRLSTLDRTRVCPLAAAMRRRLRDIGTGGIVCVYSEERPCAAPAPDGALGTLPALPAIFGMTLANAAVLHLAGISAPGC